MVGFLAFVSWAAITAGTAYMIWQLLVKGQKAPAPTAAPAEAPTSEATEESAKD